MKKKLLSGLATGLFLVGMVGTANAMSLTIENAGFEEDVLTNGSWINGTDDWTTTGGTFNPTSSQYTPVEAPEGNNIAWLNSGYIYQDLAATYQENTDYSLTFAAGWRLDNPSAPNLQVEFRTAGNVSLATLSSGDISLTQGEWTSNTLTLMSTSIGASAIGENIRIVFSRINGGQVNIDDVKLGADPVPEPATMLLMGTGLAGLIGSRRKKKD